MNVDREDELGIQAPPGAASASERWLQLDGTGMMPEAQCEVGPGGEGPEEPVPPAPAQRQLVGAGAPHAERGGAEAIIERVLSCLLALYTAVMSFEILFPFGLWVFEPGWLLNHSQLV